MIVSVYFLEIALFILLGSILQISWLDFLSVIVLTMSHHFFEPHAFFRFSLMTVLTIFSRISVLILFCSYSLTPFRIFLLRILHKCFTKEDMYRGSRHLINIIKVFTEKMSQY